jgi:hypothetical protein
MYTKHRHELRLARKARSGTLVDPSLLAGVTHSKRPDLKFNFPPSFTTFAPSDSAVPEEAGTEP